MAGQGWKRNSKSSLIGAFAADRRGAVLMQFGLASTVIFAIVGGAIDFNRWLNAKHVTTASVDAAVLAGARTLQLDPGNPTAALDKARAYFNKNMAGKVDLSVNTIDFSLADNNMSITATGTATIATTVLNIIGISSLKVLSDTNVGLANAKLQFGGQGGSNLEIALMLDVTSSMCDNGVGPCSSGTKMDGLKEAAKKLVDMVVPENQGSHYSKMSIVPFSTRVRVGQDSSGGGMMKVLTDLDPVWSGWYQICTDGSGSGGGEGNGNWTCHASQAQQQIAWKIMPCVTDRAYDSGGFDYGDDAPGTGNRLDPITGASLGQTGTWLNAHDGGRMTKGWDSSTSVATTQKGLTSADPAYHWNYNWNGSCADVDPNNEIQPLTTSKSNLKNKIDGLVAYGSTAGALGTAWAWYTLSPKWNNVWSGQAKPAAYADLTTTQANGRPVLRKVAVLMSDGVFNTMRGWKDQDQQTVSNHAKQLCENMKAKGIEIFTVGLALDQLSNAERLIAEDTLRSCGTDINHFYSTLNITELQTAFQDIAYQLTSIALTR